MAWKIKHVGSARAVENLTRAEVLEGLEQGAWDGGDLVMGPADRTWTALADHPQLADAVVLAEPQFVDGEEDEERLDMNPLIDVCLVLLVFFMIGVSYLNLPKGHRVPKNKPDNPGALRPVSDDQVKELMIVLTVTPGPDGRPVYMLEREKVEPADLERKLMQYVKDTRKTELLIEPRDVNWGAVVKAIDAAAGARIKSIHFKAGVVSRP